MFRKSRKWRFALAGAGVAAVAAGGSAVALATGSSNGKVYAGCLSAGRLSNIRINPTGKVSCRHGGTEITWNQTGPAGAQGLTGPQGPQGARGPAGAQGVQGVQGVQGQTGSPGANGNTVLHGSGAPASTLGSVGDYYVDTAAHALYGPKSASGWGSPTSLVGPPGAPGISPTLSPAVQSSNVDVPTGDAATWIFTCAKGQIATGGGGGFAVADANLVLEYSAPTLTNSAPTGWWVQGVNTSGSTETMAAYVICLPTTAPGAGHANVAARPAASVHLSALSR